MDTVIEGSRWPLPVSLSGACYSATADTRQDAPPHACAGLSGSLVCEAVVTPPPEALLTAWSDRDCHSSLPSQITLLPAEETPPHGRS